MANQDNSSGLKILVLRFSAMGDVVLTTPFIRLLRRGFPNAQIDFIVKEQFAALVSQNRNIDNVLHVPLGSKGFLRFLKYIRKNEYDIVFDLQRNSRSSMILLWSGAKEKIKYKARRFERFVLVKFKKNIYRENLSVPLRFIEALKIKGLEDDGLGLELSVSDKAVKSIYNIYKENNIYFPFNVILLAPGAGRATKMWPVENYIETADYFIKEGYNVVTIGGGKDIRVCEKIKDKLGENVLNLCGKTDLEQTVAIISLSRLLISNDTGVMHLATGLNTPVVAIFGPTTEELGFFPFRSFSKVVQVPLNCRPCSFHGTDKCPKGHFNCMKMISADMVIEAAESLIIGD